MNTIVFPLSTMLAIAAASALTNMLIQGAIQGLLAGALAGAIIIPALNSPDTSGRGFFFGIMLTLGVALYQVVFKILPVTGDSAGTVINATVGSLLLVTGAYMLVAFFIGTIIGFLTLVPGDVIKGAAMGLVVGAASGAILLVLLNQFNIIINGFFFQGLVGLITAALFMSITGGADEAQTLRRKKKKKDPW